MMYATRYRGAAIEGLAAQMRAGAELRVDPNRERAFLRGNVQATIVTWAEAAELGRRVPHVLFRTWGGFLCFRARGPEPPRRVA